MAKPRVKNGGGWAAINYSRKLATQVGGLYKLYQALGAPNTCKTCAVGMGGARGGMTNEEGAFFQVCKKSMQAQAQDMLPGIPVEFWREHSVAALSKFSGRELEALGRMTHPLYLAEGSSHFQVLDWTDAMARLISKWRAAAPGRSFFYASGRSSMEAAFMLQLMVRQWGSNNINNCSYYCHQASGVGMGQSLGTGASTVSLTDVKKCDLVVLIGANPASNHPRLMPLLAEVRQRGGKVVVINPLQELGLQRFNVPSVPTSLLFGSEIASSYLQPHCGGDMALLKAAACLLWREGRADAAFMQNHCNGLDEFKRDIEKSDLQVLVDQAGISIEELLEFCDILSASKRTIFAWAMGITHQKQGVESVRAIANLALLNGMIGKPGAGLLPIRGHSNVQGIGSVGVVPELKPEMAQAILQESGVSAPEEKGMDTMACMQAANKGRIDFAMMLGGNLYASNPDLKWASESLQKIDFITFLSTTMNLGHLHGRGKDTLILPVCARDEEKQPTAQESMFNYVRLSSGGRKGPASNLRSESEIIGHVAESLLGNEQVPWRDLRDHHKVRDYISRVAPGMQSMNKLDQGYEFTVSGRIKHKPEFATTNGKANLAIVQPPDARPEKNKFNLMTIRSEGQFNSIIYEDEDLYRGVSHRLVVLMNCEDMEKVGISEGDPVVVGSAIGQMQVEAASAPIRLGNVAMYYPEANEIVPAQTDAQSKTPVFKRIIVSIKKTDR